MYYERIDSLNPLPDHIKNRLLDFAYNRFSTRTRRKSIGNFETANKNSLAYISSQQEFERLYGISGFIEICKVTDVLEQEIKNYYKDNLNFNNIDIQLQGLQGGNFFVPHTDSRKSSWFYILETGGDNVLTSWYSVKDEFKNLDIPTNIAIPYNKILEEDSCVLPVNTWYKFSHKDIHSVSNLERLRIVLCLCIIDQ